MTIHNLLSRTETTLTTLAVSGLANAGPAPGELTALADELAATGLGKLGERLRAVADAPDEHARAAAWAAAWAGVGLVRTRLLKPAPLDVQDAVSLPQAPNVLFPRPAGDLDSLDGLLTVLQSARPLARTYAAGRLTAFGDQAVPGLLAVQGQCGRCIRFLVIETLERIGTDAALAGLVGLLGDGDVARPVEAALLALGQRSMPLVAEALAQANVKDKKRRRAAAKILWRLGATQPLQAALNDKDEWVQACAQAALWPVKRLIARADEKTVAGLPASVALFEQGQLALEALEERLALLPRNHLADAVAALWHTGAEEPLLARYLAQITAGRDKKTREQAAALVARLGHPSALPTLLDLLETGWASAPIAIRLVADGLAEPADSTAVWPLIHAARQMNQMPHVRAPLIEALGRIGDPAATPALLEMLNDTPHRTNRDVIEKALVAIGTPAVEALGHALKQSTDAALERALMKIKTPQAKATLAAYRAGTDELTRLLSHLADGKASDQVIEQMVNLGVAALDPLLDLLTRGTPDGQVNAVRTLQRLAPALTVEQRERVITALRAQLRAQQPNLPPASSWLYAPLAEQLAGTLCDMDVSAALPEIRDAIILVGVGKAVLEAWQRTQRPWLVDVIAQGIRSPQTRYHALPFARQFPLDEETRPRLWPPVEAILQSETDSSLLYFAVVSVRAWGDPKALPLLQTLRKRLSTVTGHAWYKDLLTRELDAALVELGRKGSLLGRLLSKG